MTQDKDKNKAIAQQLKDLTAKKGPVSPTLLASYKDSNQKHKKVLDSIKEKEKTVPEISAETGLSTDIVLWHLTAMKKYGQAEVILAKSGYLKYIAMHEESKS